MNLLRRYYNDLIPDEYRYYFYKLRNPKKFSLMLTDVNHHEKGVFSLTGFLKTQSIFVHITKTAGTSVAQSLYGQLPYHYTSAQYRVIFGKRRFKDFYKFAFVRNPWDRLYSAYSYLKSGGWDKHDQAWADENIGGINSFNEFVLDWLNESKIHSHLHFKPQFEFLYDHKGNLLIDDLGYFETLEEDFRRLKKRVPGSKALQHKNPTTRKINSYADTYTEEAKRKVEQLYKKDIETFGYTFDHYSKKSTNDIKKIDYE